MGYDFSTWGDSESPCEAELNFGWSIKRAPPDRIIKMAVISSKHYGIYTHYHRGRSTPHLKSDCPACADGLLPRWYGYFLALLYPTKERVVFEFTAKCVEAVLKEELTPTALRGRVVQASRPRGKPNSPVVLQFTDSNCNPADLTKDEDIRPILAHIWGFRESAPIPKNHLALSDASEHAKAESKTRSKRIRPRDCSIDQAGEIQGLANIFQELPGQQHLFTEGGNGRPQT